MKWLEIISVRRGKKESNFNQKELLQTIQNENGKENDIEILVFQHSILPSEFCILLCHMCQNFHSRGSDLGNNLVWILKEYGFVNHTVWNKS